MTRKILTILVGIVASWVSPSFAEEPTIEQLLDATDDVTRGESSKSVIRMYVKTDRYERTMKMESWSQGTEKTLIRILEPSRDAGMSTLKVGDNIWNYLPKVDRTMKVPGAMMSGSWMGSHFSNDDLVKDSRLSEDFTGSITERPAEDGSGHYIVELVPQPNAAVVWGRIVVEVSADLMPMEVGYYDEDGSLKRTMRFLEVLEMDGRRIPSVMELIPADKPGEVTRITYESLDFDADVSDSRFSLQSLKR
jgi:outer membrane lipoprotein-sorting protein